MAALGVIGQRPASLCLLISQGLADAAGGRAERGLRRAAAHRRGRITSASGPPARAAAHARPRVRALLPGAQCLCGPGEKALARGVRAAAMHSSCVRGSSRGRWGWATPTWIARTAPVQGAPLPLASLRRRQPLNICSMNFSRGTARRFHCAPVPPRRPRQPSIPAGSAAKSSLIAHIPRCPAGQVHDARLSPPSTTPTAPLPRQLHHLSSSRPRHSTMAQRHPTWTQSYIERALLPDTSPLTAYLLRLIAIKRTNLCLSADVTTTQALLSLAEEVGDSICLLKTHADIISDFNDRTVKQLRDIAKRKKFLVFEDRKFGDIGGNPTH